METVLSKFEGFPSQLSVIRLMLKQGISVKDGKAYCGNIEIGDSALGRAAGVDRRVVRSTVERIMDDPELLKVFSKLKSITLLSDVASEIGCTTLEIIPNDATQAGILADITARIFDAGVSVRQAVVEDPGDQSQAHLIIVLDGQLPPEYIPSIRACRGVNSVIIR